MRSPIRLTIVLTHPAQYYSPWFRHIAAGCPEIDLTVLYASAPRADQQGVDFDRAFTWDVPLLDGYAWRIVQPPAVGHRFGADRFTGLDVPGIVEAVAESRPDVVLVPGWHSITLLRALRECRRLGVPVLYRGDSNLQTAPSGWRYAGWLVKTRAMLRLFDGYLAVGTRSREYLARFGVPGDRVFDSPHCVDNAFFQASAEPHRTPAGRRAARRELGLPEEAFAVLFAGKLLPRKRPLDAIRAVGRMREAALLLVGAGPLEEACRAEARRLGIGVAYAGFLNQSRMGAAYGAADCLAVPSDSGETWGLVVNEALATGLPCVVSDRVGCGPDLIEPGRSGLVYRAGDVDALADALTLLQRRRQEGTDFAPSCRAVAARHTYDAATAGLLEACRAVAVQKTAIADVHDGEPSGEAMPRSHEASACLDDRTASDGAPRVLACCGGMVIVAGLERATFEVLRVIRERGAAVHCIVNDWENQQIVAMAERIGASWSTGEYGYQFARGARNPWTLGRWAWLVLVTSAGLLRDCWRFRPTHVLLPEFIAALRNAPALLVLRLFGVRTLLRLGNAPVPGPYYRRLWRWAINPLVHGFVCNSSFTERQLRGHGVPPPKIVTIHNTCPIRPGEPAVTSDLAGHKVIYVGQIIPGKGLDLLLEAVAMLARRGHPIDLDVIGTFDGWEPNGFAGFREAVLARAGAADLASRVRFLGWREDVPDLMASAVLHCCPSREPEGFGIVTLEAKLAGIPSVVTPVGALPEIVSHREDGWVCAGVSAGALADGLEYFLEERTRLVQAGRAARASAARFGRARFAQAWWDVFVPAGRARRGRARLANVVQRPNRAGVVR